MIPLSPEQRRHLRIALIAAASIATLAFAAWVLALDREVRLRFAGARWALPAQVYAAPTLIYPGLNLGRKAVGRELERLGYRQVPLLGGAGTYTTKAGRVTPASSWCRPRHAPDASCADGRSIAPRPR